MKVKYLALLAAVAVSSVIPLENASAVPVSAQQSIRDILAYDAFGRNLERVNTDSSGTVVETNDATIVAENSVSNSFGIVNSTDVTYTHTLDWLTPAPGTYLVAQLQIDAWGNIAGDDVVFADTFNLGTLNNGTISSLLFSTSTYNVLAFISDNVLNVRIDKNIGGGLANLNVFSVYGSTLSVRYEPVEVPEPTTLALLGFGLAGAALRKRVA